MGLWLLTLLVADKVLGSSNDTGILDALDGLGHRDTSENGIGRETLPVAAALGGPAKGTGDGAELDVNALALVFLAHGLASIVHKSLVKGGRHGHACGENRGEIGKAHTGGRILQTQTVEAESRHGAGLADTLFALPTVESKNVRMDSLDRIAASASYQWHSMALNGTHWHPLAPNGARW